MFRPLDRDLRNALAYIVPEFFWGCAWALCLEGPMAAAFADSFGGSEGYVGLAWLVMGVALAIPMLIAARWVEPLRTKRGLVFWGHVAGSVLFGLLAVLLASVGDEGAQASRIAYLGGVALFCMSVGFLIPGWMALVGELFPPSARPRVLAASFVANRIGGLIGGAVTYKVFASELSTSDSWVLLFTLAAVVSAIGSLPFLWIQETERTRPSHASLAQHLRGLGRMLQEAPSLGRFMLADGMGIFSLVVVAFYADAAFRRDGFPKDAAGTWVAIGALGHLASSLLVLALGPRVAPRIWIALGILTAASAAASLAAFSSSEAYAWAAFAGGFYMGSRTACHAPQVMLLVPGRDGTSPIGLAGALATGLQGVVPWIAGLALPLAGYSQVFLVAGAVAALGGLLLLVWVREAPPGPTS